MVAAAPEKKERPPVKDWMSVVIFDGRGGVKRLTEEEEVLPHEAPAKGFVLVAGNSRSPEFKVWLREELGDVLLQVVLHARLAEELPEDERWTIDDVAGGLVDKMIRRNPHVFAGAEAGTLEEITENWERIKRAEKARHSVLDGVALSQPALALATQILDRAARRGIDVPLPPADTQADAIAPGARVHRVIAAAGVDDVAHQARIEAGLDAHRDGFRACRHAGSGEEVVGELHALG
jgi:hypothetical protein